MELCFHNGRTSKKERNAVTPDPERRAMMLTMRDASGMKRGEIKKRNRSVTIDPTPMAMALFS